MVLEGKKANNITGPGCHNPVNGWPEHEPTEAEEAYIIGNFTVDLMSEDRYVISPYRIRFVKNLTTDGFPFYCGRIRCKSGFDLPIKPSGRLMLGLNGASMASATVRINGTDCGTLRWKPYVLDITGAVRQGHNTVEIEMSTTLVNAFGPNRRTGIKENRGIGPLLFIEMDRHQRNYELFDFGFGSAVVYKL